MYAIAGDACIAILKTIGAVMTGSASLFGEAVHSVADTANQILLLIGVQRSRKHADDQYEYGYGSERFFWALISACGIFFLGAGVAIYHGIERLSHPSEMEDPLIALAILGISLIVEAVTLRIAYHELRRNHPDGSIWEAFAHGDPVTLTVVYEDAAALVGIVTALVGIAMAHLTGNAVYDAWGSIGVGLILALIAILLMQKNRQFLLGKAIPEEMRDEIIKLLEADPYIEKVYEFKSEVLDMSSYRIKCEVEFNGAALVEDIMEHDNVREEYGEVCNNYEGFKKFIAYQTNRIPRLIGRKIDEIEKRIKSAYPKVKYIDIEIN